LSGRTGRRLMYAFNITGDLEAMYRHQERVMELGGTCVMVSLHWVGLPAVVELRRRGDLVIHGHRNGWGMLGRHPFLGVEYPAWQKLWRLAGADHMHVNGLQNKFWEPDESVVRSIEACLAPLFPAPGPAHRVLPVISSGQWGGQAPETYRRAGTVDLLYVAGGGIMAHPMGPGAGVRALQQAWEAAVRGIPLAEYAREHEELRGTLARFGVGLGRVAGSAREGGEV
jgi:ribulose-bisphosphate carboxylase large chain